MPIIKSEYIRRKLSYIKSIVEDDNKQQFYDINTSAEYIFMQILNDVYGWSLINANEEKPNFLAIDLIDTVNETVFQVTSEVSTKKVREDTIEKFNELVKQDEYKKYAHYKIKMFYIKNKPNFSDKILEEFESKGVPKSHLYGIEDINREVSANPIIATKVFKTLCKILHDKVCDSDISPQLTTKLGKSTIKGRKKELQEIKQHLNSSKALLIHGIGGIGKSTIASYYLHQHKNEFDYYGFFEGLDDFVNKLEIAFKIKVEQGQDKLTVVLHELTKLDGNKLLVIDNIQEVTENKKTIEKILDLKEHNGFKILLTSREEIDGIDKYLLDTLSMDDAKELFNSIYQVEDEVLLKEILEYLDCHAFFVEKTAMSIKKTLTPQMIREKFKNGEFSKISVKRKENFNKYLNELFRLDSLDEEEVLMLKQLSILPSIAIEFKFLQAIFDKSDDENFEDILNYLCEKGWLNSFENGYKLHQIVKEYIWIMYTPTFNEIEIIVDKYIIFMGHSADSQIVPDSIKAIILYDALVHFYNFKKIKNESMAVFFTSFGNIYIHLADFDKSLNLHLKSLEIKNEIFDETTIPLAESYNNIGIIYKYKQDYEKALSYYKKALHIFEETLGERNKSTVRLYNNLGEVYRVLKKYAKALNFFTKSLEINQTLFGDNHFQTAISYNNLSTYYIEINQYKKALPFILKSIKIKENLKKINNSSLAKSYDNLAILYNNMQEDEKAFLYYLKALKIWGNEFGMDYHSTIISYENFLIFLENNTNRKNFFFAKRALSLFTKDEDKNIISIIYYIMSSCSYHMNNLNDAYKYLSNTLKIWEEINHPNILMAREKLKAIEDERKIKVKNSTLYAPKRNDLCPCNSGKKYKKCCGKPK